LGRLDDLETEDVRAGVMTHHIEVELSPWNFGHVQGSREDPCFIEEGARQTVPEG
jgi:hypothetical protein